MKPLLWLAAALVALAAFPATAGAADVTGVAIAKSPARKTIVVASRTGALKTIRARKQFGKIRIGQRLSARGGLLADGTLAASAVKRVGSSKQVRFRAVVVKLEHSADRLLLSGGRSVFAIRLRAAQRATSSDGGELQPGDKVVCEATVEHGGLAADEKSVDEVGHTDRLELHGIYLYETDGGFDIAVVHRGLVHVQVPDGLDLPKLARGDEVVLLVTVESNGSFTLVKVHGEGDGEGDKPAVKAELWVEGAISQLRVDGVSVKPDGDRPLVSCALPHEKLLAGFAVGDHVKLHCRYDGGRYVIVELKSDKAFIGGDGAAFLYAYGAMSELGSEFVRIQPDGDHPSIRCDFAGGLDLSGFAVGDHVKLYCKFSDGKYQLVGMKSETASVTTGDTADLYAYGAITEIGSNFVRIQPDGDHPSIRCDFAEGLDLSGFAVGDRVKLHCIWSSGKYMLVELRSEHADVVVKQ